MYQRLQLKNYKRLLGLFLLLGSMHTFMPLEKSLHGSEDEEAKGYKTKWPKADIIMSGIVVVGSGVFSWVVQKKTPKTVKVPPPSFTFSVGAILGSILTFCIRLILLGALRAGTNKMSLSYKRRANGWAFGLDIVLALLAVVSTMFVPRKLTRAQKIKLTAFMTDDLEKKSEQALAVKTQGIFILYAGAAAALLSMLGRALIYICMPVK